MCLVLLDPAAKKDVLHDETVRCNIDLPRYAVEAIDREAKRTGMQRATFLRFIVLGWIEKERRSGIHV